MLNKEDVINLDKVIDINLVTSHKFFPLNSQYIKQDGRVYRYIVDSEGYKWIGEELWLERGGC